MSTKVILASGSAVRAELLKNANVEFEVVRPKVDEENMKKALIAEMAKPRDVADYLAEQKARKVSSQFPDQLVIGCDQVLDFEGTTLTKPSSIEDSVAQLKKMRSKSHKLYSAVVIYQNGTPVWRHIGRVELHMASLSNEYIIDYVTRNWSKIQHCVGGYQIENEGVRLFDKVEGDFFHVLGLPLLELLSYLARNGTISR